MFRLIKKLFRKAPASEWDDRTAELKKFPVDKFEHIPVVDGVQANEAICLRAMETGNIIFGEVRWFGPGDGLLFIPRL
jgi:hypothetical protein